MSSPVKALAFPLAGRIVIRDLIEAAADVALIDFHQREFVESKRNPGQAMFLEEAEAEMDAAIRRAWELFAGEPLTAEDPVSFILDPEGD